MASHRKQQISCSHATIKYCCHIIISPCSCVQPCHAKRTVRLVASPLKWPVLWFPLAAPAIKLPLQEPLVAKHSRNSWLSVKLTLGGWCVAVSTSLDRRLLLVQPASLSSTDLHPIVQEEMDVLLLSPSLVQCDWMHRVQRDMSDLRLVGWGLQGLRIAFVLLLEPMGSVWVNSPPPEKDQFRESLNLMYHSLCQYTDISQKSHIGQMTIQLSNMGCWHSP